MPRRQDRFRKSLWTIVFNLALAATLIFAGATTALAQTAETLSQVTKVFVQSFGSDDTANKLREAMVKQLRKKAKLSLIHI